MRLGIESLKGQTVLETAMVGNLPMIFFEDGTVAEVWCDPEGNGAGFLKVYDDKGDLT